MMSSRKNSLAHYDESRPVNTPLGLMACAAEGVQPEELVRRPETTRKRQMTGLELQKHEIREQFFEAERLRLLNQVQKRYAELLHRDAPDPPRTSPRPLAASKLEEDKLKEEIETAVSDDLTVARHFLRIKKDLEKQERARQTLERKELLARERHEALSEERLRGSVEKMKAFEVRLRRVVQSRDRQLEQWKEHHVERQEAMASKQQAADRNVELKLSATSTKAATYAAITAQKIQAAEKARQQKLEEMAARIAAANEIAKKKKEEVAREEEIHDLKVELKRRAFELSQQRAARAAAFRRDEIREQQLALLAQDEEERLKREKDAKRRAIIREVLAKQREAVEKHCEAHRNKAYVPPPEWLVQRITRAEEERKHALIPHPPANSGREERRNKTPSRDGLSDSTAVLPSVARPRFTIDSPRGSEKQVFGKWMFD